MTVTTEVLRAHVDALVDLENQKRELADDIKEAKADAKRAGIHPKALVLLAKRRLDPDKAIIDDHIAELVDQYEFALNEPTSPEKRKRAAALVDTAAA